MMTTWAYRTATKFIALLILEEQGELFDTDMKTQEGRCPTKLGATRNTGNLGRVIVTTPANLDAFTSTSATKKLNRLVSRSENAVVRSVPFHAPTFELNN